jgi:tripartite-type tricarboxylate transporter receptor subunit TctC
LLVAPDLPTIAEAGFPALAYSGGACMLLPGRTPAHLVAALDHAIAGIAASADNLTALTRLGVVPSYMNSATVTKWLRDEHTKWGPIVDSSGFRPTD